MEHLPKIKQCFRLITWLQTYTRLKVFFSFNGEDDSIMVKVYYGEEELINAKVESVIKKSEERLNREMQLIVVQLLELKNDVHYR